MQEKIRKDILQMKLNVIWVYNFEVYSYEFKSKALKQLKNLDRPIQRKIIKRLEFLCKQEILFNIKHLTDPKIGNYRFRIGDYRVIFDIDGKMITILLIGHRREIYK